MKELFNIKAITRITVYDETRSYDYEYTPERVSKPLIGEKKLIDGYYEKIGKKAHGFNHGMNFSLQMY